MIEQEKIADLTDESKAYIEKRIALLKLEIIEKVSSTFSIIISGIIIAFILLLFLIAFTFFLGLGIGNLVNNDALGFSIVSVFYLILIIVLALNFEKFLKSPFQNLIIKNIAPEDV